MSNTDPQGRDRGSLNGSGQGASGETKNVPPLVWIIVAVLIVLAIVAWLGWGRTTVTPHGTSPAIASSTSAASTPGSGG